MHFLSDMHLFENKEIIDHNRNIIPHLLQKKIESSQKSHTYSIDSFLNRLYC